MPPACRATRCRRSFRQSSDIIVIAAAQSSRSCLERPKCSFEVFRAPQLQRVGFKENLAAPAPTCLFVLLSAVIVICSHTMHYDCYNWKGSVADGEGLKSAAVSSCKVRPIRSWGRGHS